LLHRESLYKTTVLATNGKPNLTKLGVFPGLSTQNAFVRSEKFGLAAILDVPLVAAAQNVVPVAVTAAESVERLRDWASGRCLNADDAGIYLRAGKASPARRRVARDPSAN
jgi:hypothetical protein